MKITYAYGGSNDSPTDSRLRELIFTVDSYRTVETSQPKMVLTAREVVELFQTKTPEKVAARDICEAMNKQLTARQLNYSTVKNLPVTGLNLPISTMKFLHSKNQLTPKYKSGFLYDFYKSGVDAIMPYLLVEGTKKRSIDNSIPSQYRQLDIDFKSDANGKNKALEVFNKIRYDFPLAGISVGGCGVFAFFEVSGRCEAANKNQIKAYLEKLFSEKYSFDFDFYFDSIANTQIRGLGYTEDVAINENCEIHDFDFTEILNISKNQDSDFNFVDSPLMDFLSNPDYLERYLSSKGFQKDRKGRFLAPYQTTSQGSPVYKSESGTLFLKAFSTSLQEVLGTSKPLHLRQLIMVLEGLETNKQANEFIFNFFGINVNWNKTETDTNREAGNVSVIENPSKNHSYTLKENQFIFHVLGGQKLDKGLYQICGGTGSGKSVFVAQNFQKTIIISRNVTTLENYNSKGFVRFIPCNKSEHYADLQSNNFEKITVTYESFEKLRKTLNLDGYTIVFDEAHLLNESFWEVKTVTKYCYNSINELSKTNTVILMSANNIHLNLPNTDFEAKLNFVKPTVCRDVNVVYNGSFEYLKDKITERLNDKKRVLLYTNRTEEKYISELIKNAFPQNSLFFFDGSKHGQTNLENLEYDITVTTSACTTGKDINTKDLAVILYGIDRNIHRSNINQFFGRARDYKSASFDLIFEFKNDNENYGKYSHSGVLNGAYDIARATIAASVNDWAFERENKDRFVTKNDDGVTVVDWFEIDNFLERQISKHTIFNTNLLDKFLRSHGYNPTIEILTDSEKEKEEKATVVSPLELYSLELDQIFDGKELETDFLTNALNRVEALQKVGYDKSDAILLAHLFGSKMKWKRFIHLLFIEGSLLMKNDKGFSNLFDKVLTALNDFYSASQIVEILQGFELQKKEKVTKLGAIIKQSKRIKNDDVKNVRFVLKNLKDYYDFDTKRTGDTRLYKIVKTDYLQGLQPSLIIVKELKKYIETL